MNTNLWEVPEVNSHLLHPIQYCPGIMLSVHFQNWCRWGSNWKSFLSAHVWLKPIKPPLQERNRPNNFTSINLIGFCRWDWMLRIKSYWFPLKSNCMRACKCVRISHAWNAFVWRHSIYFFSSPISKHFTLFPYSIVPKQNEDWNW